MPALRADRELRENFFSRLKLLFYAGAGLSQPVWDAYRQLARDTCGERVVMVTGLGSTETAPMAIQTTWETERAGVIGIPIPGVEAKLVSQAGKLEARVRGPNITPGYWRQPELTRKAFDEDGFYKFGDAVRFVDPSDVNKGFLFDGRFSEDFKLATGTWVSVGPLRARIVSFFAPFVRDVVITGHDRDDVGMMIFADVDACCALCPAGSLRSGTGSTASDILRHEAVRQRFRDLLAAFAAEATGSSNRVSRAILLEEPPSLDAREITDKGSLNQRAVLEHRVALVEELYGSRDSDLIFRLEGKNDGKR
jgi:feruloyl-CoA synthase